MTNNNENLEGRISWTPCGAAKKVAGSKHILTVRETRILNDCGQDYQKPASAELEAKVEPKKIKFTVLSHGHGDHIGDLPWFLNAGYKGNFYATPPTKDLVQQQLEDAIAFHGFKEKFTKYDLANLLNNRFIDVNYSDENHDESFQLGPDIKVRFYNAGHIIGSAQIFYEIKTENGRTMKLLFTGDLGRTDVDTPIIEDPYTNLPKDIDYIVMESTYGDRLHNNKEKPLDQLREVINYAYSNNKKIICGAFSIMRSQLILENLFRLYKSGDLPKDFKIYVDSPSIMKVNEIILKHREDYDKLAKEEFGIDDNDKENPFNANYIEYVDKKQDSRNLDELQGPFMVMSSSGTFEMGRIVDHVINNIDKENAIFLVTGYQPTSVGRMIEAGRDKYSSIRIKGQAYDFRAESRRINGYSGHGDTNEFTRFLKGIKDPNKGEQFKKIILVHGDPKALEGAKKAYETAGFRNIVIPNLYDVINLD